LKSMAVAIIETLKQKYRLCHQTAFLTSSLDALCTQTHLKLL
jgi:hypothetical protein